jgi:hypothetical protein
MRPSIRSLVIPAVVAATLAASPAAADRTADAQVATCVAPPGGMAAWWPGDGDTRDLISGRDGVLRNGARFAPGKVGQAFQLDGIDDHVRVRDAQPWHLGDHAFTIDLWVRFDSLAPRQSFVANDEAPGEFRKWIFWFDTLGHREPFGDGLRFHINNPRSGPLDPIVYLWTPAVGTWYHVAVTRTPNSQTSPSVYRLYLDGAQVARRADGHTIRDAVAPLTLGEAEGENFMDGALDEVELFRRALSGGEIRAIFQAGAEGKCKA